MKRFLIIFLIMILCVTGCSNVIDESKTASGDSNTVEIDKSEDYSYNNLIVTEVNTNYGDVVNDYNVEENNYNDIVVESDDDLVSYMEGVQLRVNDIVAKEETSKSEENVLRNTFITLTDFIFYDGEIKGKKFSDITDSCKEKIIDIYTKIDEKIESKYPHYKENIKETGKKVYTGAVEKAKEIKEGIVQKYRDYVGEERYNNTAEVFEDDKQNVKDVYEVYKPYIEEGKEKAKSGIEKAKEKLNEWYQNYKENGD